MTATAGLHFERRSTRPGVHPYDEVAWERRDATIGNESGRTVFEQKGVEVPAAWSVLATNIVASKYFRGHPGTPEREWSVRQLIDRVAGTIAAWGRKDGYFATPEDADTFEAELTALLLHQRMAFNSPVWFNLGLEERPNLSACYINSVRDDMGSIMDLAKTEALLFKGGSGAGVNLSAIRGSRERMTGGGIASGPISFMKGYDAFAGVVKSGGKTRRAAKMIILDADHPDIEDFIETKVREERKAQALIREGYDPSFNGEAYGSVFFQNANHSVRVTDESMRAVERDGEWWTTERTTGDTVATLRAQELLHKIASAAWTCGDPGIQFDTTINAWHTCPASGRINASNPCSEYMFVDDSSCNLASLNLMRFARADGSFDVEAYRHAAAITITAQEIIVGNASYPTPAIEANSRAFRPLGLGYANLGALLMSRGLAYDSDEGRAFAASLTAIMHGEALAQSARIARDCGGAFDGYAMNREPMLRVVAMHADASRAKRAEAERAGVPVDMLDAEERIWAEVEATGREHGFRNAQVTVLAPTGCLVGGSLVLTDRGLVRLRSLGDVEGDQWQNLDVRVSTDEGPQQATRFFVNGAEPVVTVTTGRGYRIQGTPTHRIKVVDGDGRWVWRRFADLQPDDQVPMTIGGMVGEPRRIPLPPLGDAYFSSDVRAWAPREVTPDLAELVGYFMGDGSLHAKGLRFCVDTHDADVVERLTHLGRHLFGIQGMVTPKQGYIEVAFHSVRLTEWWDACGFTKLPPTGDHRGKGYAPRVPDALLATNDPEVYRAFVRGLFEADGNVNHGYVAWTTAAPDFAHDVQTLLLALGFVTTHRVNPPAFGHRGKNDMHVVRLLNQRTGRRFLAEIGMMSERKRHALEGRDTVQSAKHDRIPIDRQTIEAVRDQDERLADTCIQTWRRTGGITREAATRIVDLTGDEGLAVSLHYFFDAIATAELGEEQLTYDLSVPENVTYIANGFVSHNTISFLMDCDTTGIEPDIALIKYKKLVGEGYLKIVNTTVPAALRALGYTLAAIDAIVRHIDETGTVEGAADLRPEHLPVFDCALKPAAGTRSIAPMGHLRMMAAAQPFLSGAISKTVNLPNDATVEDIESVYLEAWRLGLKAVAVYRDGCKSSQPLNTSKAETAKADDADHPGHVATAEAAEEEIRVLKEAVAACRTELGQLREQAARPVKAERRRLPEERAAVTHKFQVAGHQGYLTVGLYEDGTPGEIFVKMAKEGSTVSGFVDAWATAVSMAIQAGYPLTDIVNKFAHVRFEPAGFTGNGEIPMAKSIVDYVARWLGARFCDEQVRSGLGLQKVEGAGGGLRQALRIVAAAADTPPVAAAAQPALVAAPAVVSAPRMGRGPAISDTPSCPVCGGLTRRSGSCATCETCGSTTGCS